MKKLTLLFFAVLLCVNFSYGKTVKFVKELKISEKTSFGKKISKILFGKSQIEVHPYSICVLNENRIVVTDCKKPAILLLNGEGKILKTITQIGKVEFGCPVSICKDNLGNIYVSDSVRQGIVKISKNFKEIQLFKAFHDSRPTGITILNNNLYCIDTKHHFVNCFNLKGDKLFSFGKRGTANGEFNFPTHITNDGNNLYIVDALNFRVQILTEKGEFISTFGNHGDGGGDFSKPKGLAIDKKNRVFISDVMFDNIQIFSKIGEFLYFFGEPGKETGQFWMPSDIDVFNSKIFVADTYNKRIQIFNILEESK